MLVGLLIRAIRSYVTFLATLFRSKDTHNVYQMPRILAHVQDFVSTSSTSSEIQIVTLRDLTGWDGMGRKRACRGARPGWCQTLDSTCLFLSVASFLWKIRSVVDGHFLPNARIGAFFLMFVTGILSLLKDRLTALGNKNISLEPRLSYLRT